MVLRIIQHLLLCARFGAVVLAHEILLEPSYAEVREFGSINLTCSHSSHIEFMILKTINQDNVESTSTIYLERCKGEGPIVDAESYDFYCIDSKSLIVTLKSVQRSRHMDHFTCKSISSTSDGISGTEPISSNEAILYVTIPVSDIVLQNESNTPVTTVEWMETVFVCITENVFPAPDIIWYVNDAVLPNGTLNASITQVATTNKYPRSYMSILRMFPERFDNIINCTANNTNDKQMSRWIRMLVYCSPRPNQNMSLQSYFASALFVHKTISFEIYAFPEPGASGFTWQKWENVTSWINLHNDDSTSISTSGWLSNLTLRNITQQSFGKYRLNVTNNIGLYTHEFVLSPNDKPRPPTHFESIEALTTDTSVCVSWRPGFNGGHPQTFILDYRKLESNNDWSITVLDAEENVMNTTFSSLISGTVYEFKIMSTNEKGNSSVVGPVTIKTKELGEVNSSTGKLFVSAMSGGKFSILVIVAVSVGAVVYKRRNNKKKPDTFGMASVENRNTSGHVLPNERATPSTLELSEEMGIQENVLCTTSHISTSIVSPSKKLHENVQGTKRKTNRKEMTKGRKGAFCVTYMEECPEEGHSEDRVETSRQPESVLQSDGKHETRIPVSSLFSYVTNASYDTEFSLLPKGLQFPATVARKPEHIALNRYNALVPYDHSRVVLLNDPTFYMNACYIDGYRKRKAYIASLGPTAETTNNYITFWKMVWYENSDIIVMLTNLIEISGMKCEQYWPELDTIEEYGEVAVYCRHVEMFAEYTIRTFDVSKNKVVRQLHQLHFTAWPDKSVPDDISSLLEFRQRLQTTFTTGHGPIVIHCSAGVGRTGTLIAINNLIEEGNRVGSVDVLVCVKRLREQRVYLVQTEQQYWFIYKTLVYALEYETDSITSEMFQKYLESKDDSFFECMFDRLQMNIESESDVEVQLINQNRTLLNRSGTDIPGNKYRVRLYLDKQADDSDYINAVYLNSFKKKMHFIVAQTPTHVNVEDFIRMIFQENCVCIISLGESDTHGIVYQNEDIGLYLPRDNQTLTVGNFTVSCTRLTTNPHYIVRRMQVKHDSKIYNEEKVSYHFQYTGWEVDKVFPNDASEFVNFITYVDQYITSHKDCSGHVLVHCLDAIERCGLFCSIAIMIEKVECEHHVNIGNTIRQIRKRRSTVIQNMLKTVECSKAIYNSSIKMCDETHMFLQFHLSMF